MHVDELVNAPHRRRALPQELLARDDRDPLRPERLEVRLELVGVAASLPVGGAIVGERVGEGPVLVAPADVVEVVGEQAVDRVADHVDDSRVGQDGAHPLRDPLEARPVRVVGRGFAAHGRGWIEVRRVPIAAQLPVELGDEEVELLRAGRRHLWMEREVVVKARRPALEAPDHDQVRQRPAPRRAAPHPPAVPREPLVSAGGHSLVGSVAERRRRSRDGPRSRSHQAPSFFAASRKFFTWAVGGFPPSSFSPWRFTQMTGTFIFRSGATSVS